MEIGSHDRLQEGVLSLELPNGVNCYPNDDEASIETEQKRATDVPQKQCWVPTLGKVQQQPLLKHNSSYAKQSKPVHHVDMEDAHNLVTFSALAGTLPPSTTSSCIQVQPDMMHLYEKFTQEMGAGGARVGNSAGAPNTSHPSSEDMKTLQTALNHAKHGRKPPNCDCDGPDCPDYLEWLKKKIKLAASENQDTSKRTDSPHVQLNNIQHSHLQNQPYLQANGDHQHPTSSYPQQQQRTNAGQVACSKLPPIPCSPQVLSIAKERNVSLQTAIAIEALTQLSGTGTQGPGAPDQALLNNNLHHHQHTQSLASPLLNCTKLIPSSAVTCPSSRPPGLHTDQQAAVSCEHHRPQSQGQPPHASTSPYRGQGNPRTFGRSPKQWLQDTHGASEERLYHDVGTPRTRPDPMSELKDLLGDANGKFGNSSFKLPSTQQLTENEDVTRIKQGTDIADHSASKGHYNLDNGQLQVRHYPGTPMSPGQAAIRHSTQAALQQHLHYKRNLFSSHSPGFGASAAPFQNLKKWWPQMEANAFNHLSIKQELKEPKRKKNSQVSPVMKAMSGMLPGPVLPKPKQIIIKKSKQKASVPTFLPKSQITVEKTSVLMMGRANTPNNLQPDSLPLLPSHSNSTQVIAAGFPAPAQSQVSISNLSMASSSTHSALSMNNPTLMGSVPPQMAHGTDAKSEEVGSLVHSDASTASSLTSTSIPNTSQLPGLVNIDPKYEELILQFEAEFGDSAADTPSSEAMSETVIASQIMTQSQTSAQDLTSPSTQNQPSSNHTPESSYTPHRNKKETDANKDESEVQKELTLYQTSTVTPVKEQQDPQSAISQNHDCPLVKHPQQSQMQETFSIPSSPITKRMKFEASGDVAVLSTTCFSEEDTPTKDGLPFSPSLKGFLESPLKFLDTPTRSLLDTPSKDLQADSPNCTCVEQPPEKDEGPYYNHLGSGPTVASIRDLMETRYGEKGEAIRIEKVVYTGREGKSSRGCPIAKWVIRRGSEKEKILCLVRHRAGHHCANAVIIILIMAWEGVPRSMADTLYREISDTLTKFGNPTTRRCGLNDDRTCACQGKDPDTCGASFSFGCSWSMYFNGCKYARSKTPRKFRLQGERPEEENKLRDQFQNLATEVAPLYKKLAPQAYSNQCQSETKASDCRLGLKAGRPFAGVTACLDFCAHAHKDQHNLYNGCTVVCTLTKEDNRRVGEIPPDEQLHVLPLYKLSTTDEFGSEEGQHVKMKTGAIQVLQAFRREVRKLPEPAKSCRQRRLDAKKAASEKKKTKLQQQAGETPEKTVVRTEGCFSESPQPPGNKDPAIIKQEFKANIKKDPFNGSMDGYTLQAADAIKTMCPNPAYYARGGLPTTGPPSAGDPVNGYNHSLPASHYGFFNFPSNALFAPKMRTYEGRNSSLPKAGRMAFQVDKKPDIHSPQARLAHSYPDHIEQPNQVNSQPSDYNQSRPSSVSSESSNRGTPVIKQEPMDMPVCEVTDPSQGATSTPSSTPQPNTWPGNRFNGSVVPTNWDHRNPKQRHEDFFSHEEKQMLHPHPQQQPSHSPQPWTSLAGSDTSPVPHVPPSSSPHLGAPGNIHQGSPRPPTPRPSTPHPGTPQPGLTQPFLLPHLGHSQSPSHIPQPVTPRQWASPAPSPEPNSRALAHGAYSPGLKHSSPAGAYPDKMWSKTGEIRCSTPLGVQEKAWKSCGGSAAGSTPSPAPEGRLFPDALQQSDQAFWDPGRAESDSESTKGREEDDDEVWSDSEHNFLDPNIGGVAVAPTHGSILIECARRELHATTPLKRPDRSHPSRISLVFYQHKNLQQPMHGLALWEAKMKMLAERALQRQQEAALLGLSQDELKALSKKRKWGATAAGAMSGVGQSKEKREGPVTRLAPTFHTTSMVNVSPYAFTRLTGPYSCFV